MVNKNWSFPKKIVNSYSMKYGRSFQIPKTMGLSIKITMGLIILALDTYLNLNKQSTTDKWYELRFHLYDNNKFSNQVVS
jgi:hypothetical protein